MTDDIRCPICARRAPTCRCADRRIAATRRHIAEMECELGLCDHGPRDRHVTPTPTDPRPKGRR